MAQPSPTGLARTLPGRLGAHSSSPKKGRAAERDADAEAELWKALINSTPRPPADSAARLTGCESLFELLRGGEVALLKGTALLELAEGEVPRLPRRQDLPKDAFWRSEDLFELSRQGKRQLCPGHEIIAISHSWLTAGHPDPEGEQLQKLCRFVYAWTNTQPGLLMRRIAIFIDWCSLMQEPRSPTEGILYDRALRQASLWYSHRQVRVWLFSSTPESVTPYQRRGWPHFESECAMLKAMWGDEVLDIGRCETGARHLDRGWPLSSEGMNMLVNANLERMDGSTFGICAVPLRPVFTPKAFAKSLEDKDFTNAGDVETITQQYNDMFDLFANSIETLHLSGLEWGDYEVEKFAQCLPHLRYLRELNLTNNEITELGAGDLAESVPLCKSLKKLFLTENAIHPGLEGSERLRETWKAAGKNEFWLFLWYPELSDYVKRKIATS